MPATSHIIVWYETMCSLYADAAELGIATAHIADYYLERWWAVWTPEHETETILIPVLFPVPERTRY